MPPNTGTEMGRYRAVMTETDREYISGEGDATKHQRQQSVSRVRNRITEELPQDIEILAEHRPDLLEELRKVVCEDLHLCFKCGSIVTETSGGVDYYCKECDLVIAPEHIESIDGSRNE